MRAKYYTSILSSLLFLNVSAQEASIVQSDDSLSKAYQREASFLEAQKKTLAKQESQAMTHLIKTKVLLETQIKNLEQQVAKSTLSNDQKFEDLQILEKLKKQEVSKANAMFSIAKKANAILKNEFEANESPSMIELSDLAKKVLQLTDESSRWNLAKGTFLTMEGELSEGQILKLGSSGTYGFNDGQWYLLGPSGTGQLKVLEKSIKSVNIEEGINALTSKKLLPLYLYESLTEKVSLRKASGPIEFLASILPLLFLGAIFLVIGSLFFKLARI